MSLNNKEACVMNNELGSVYLGQMIAKQAMHQAQFGKAKRKSALYYRECVKSLANKLM